jgi:hypothetical protein
MSLSYDFSNYLMQVAIVPPGSTTRVPLWTQPLQVSDSSAISLPYVSELAIELGLGMIPKITVTMAMPFLEGIQLLNTNLIVVGESMLEVQFGYTSGDHLASSPVFTAVILEPDVTISGTEIGITLVAQGIGLKETRQSKALTLTGNRKAWLELLFPNSEVDFSEVDAEGGVASERFSEQLSDISFGYASNWFNALRIARDCLCWLYVDSKIEAGKRKDIIKVFPVDARLNGLPRYLFSLFPGDGRIGPESQDKIFPILTFSRPASALFLPNAVKGLFHKGIDERTGEPYAIKFDDKDSEGAAPMNRVGNSDKGAPAADGELPDGDEQTGEGLEPHVGDQPTEESKATAQAEVKVNQWKIGIPIEVETLGVPELLPGEIVTIEGLGARYDGNYAVHEVTHTLGGGGYSTRFKAFTNTSENGALVPVLDGTQNEAKNLLVQANAQPPEAGGQDSETKQPDANAGT